MQKENPILRKVAEPVSLEEIKSRKVETIIRRMQKALDGEDDGIAIAAPQIGESLRIFVVSKKVYDLLDQESSEPTPKTPQDLIFINPEIIKESKEKMMVEEGCLSVRWLYGEVKRSKKVLVKAYDANGKPFSFGGSGLMAQIFQHEVDHLNGTLFIDKAKQLKEIPPPSPK